MKKDTCESWIYLAVTSLASFVVVGFFDCSGIFIAMFIDHYDASNSKAGWIGSLMLFFELFLSPLVVYLHHTIGFSWCMVIAGVFYVFSCLTTPFMPNLNLVFLTMAISAGIPFSFIGILSITTQREVFVKYYSLAIGQRFLFAAVGATVFSIVLPVLFDVLGWKKAFWSMLIFTPVFFLYALAYRFASDDTKQDCSQVTKENSSLLRTKDLFLLQDKVLVICLMSSTLFHFAVLIPGTFMIGGIHGKTVFVLSRPHRLSFVVYCMKYSISSNDLVQYGIRLGYPLSAAKWLLAVRNICTITARLLAGPIAGIAFRNERTKLFVQVIEFLYGLGSILCSFTRSFPLLLLYMGFCGALEGLFFVFVPLLVHEITAGYQTDDAYALFTFAAAFSFLLGIPTAGWIYDSTDDFRHVLYLVFLTSIVAAFFLMVNSFLTVTKSYVLVEGSKQEIKLAENNPDIIFNKREYLPEKFKPSIFETSV